MVEDTLQNAIEDLQKAYLTYMGCLKSVLDHGEANIDSLINALNHKHANPVAKALGLMMYCPAAEKAFPVLLDWLIIQSPLYPDVLEALVRAGDRSSHQVLRRMQEYASRNDDEAVRHLLDLATRYSDKSLPAVVEAAGMFLEHHNDHIRECAVDAIARIGLPHAVGLKNKLGWLARNDQCAHVKEAACRAIDRLCCGDTLT